jgi:DnaJ family protein C protein 19
VAAIPFIVLAVILLISYQMPIYTARLIGQEFALDSLWATAWNDSVASRVIFLTVYMIAGFALWTAPVIYVVGLLHPRYSPRVRDRTGRVLAFLTTPLRPVFLVLQRKYRQWNDEARAARTLKSLYEIDFKDHFLSFTEFQNFYQRLNDSQQIDRVQPVRRALAASLDECEDAEILLGLGKGYALPDLTARYRALIKQVHPDIAGPNDIARRVTAARDLITARRGWK